MCILRNCAGKGEGIGGLAGEAAAAAAAVVDGDDDDDDNDDDDDDEAKIRSQRVPGPLAGSERTSFSRCVQP